LTIIDRYILRNFLAGYLILMAVGIGLYILSGLLLNLDEFMQETDLPLTAVVGRIIGFYGTNIPLYYSQLAGPLMAIAAAFTFGTMLRNNELTALLAAGMPLQRLTIPMLLCAMGLVGVWVFNREIIMPPLAPQLARSHDDVLGQRLQGVFARDKNDVIVLALHMSDEGRKIQGVFLFEPDATGAPTRLIEADEAVWNESSQTWRLRRGTRSVVADGRDGGVPPGTIVKQAVDEFPIALTPGQLALRSHAQWADFLSVRQLDALLRSDNLPNWPSVNISRHVRLTQPLLQFILLMLVVPFFLTRERVNVLGAGARSLLVAGSFFLLVFLAHNVIKDASYAAVFVWTPIFVFCPIAVLQLANVRT
jgi:lipopolysaccharide export system permease protein